MIIHILKKDLRLLWPLVLIVVLLQLLEAVLAFRLGKFFEPRSLRTIVYVLPLINIMGMLVLTATLVQQDPLPDGTQDWIVRPIARRDLLLSKLLFVLLLVLGPLWLADTLLGLADGFGVAAAATAALGRGTLICSLLILPALCLAMVTRHLVETLLVALATLVLLIGGWLLW